MNKHTLIINSLVVVFLLLLFACQETNVEDNRNKVALKGLIIKQLEDPALMKNETGFELALNHIENDNAAIKKAAKAILGNKELEDWQLALANADNFQRETSLLKALITIDSQGKYARIVSNRLQTFDLRHLGETEQLRIIKLYELSLTKPQNLKAGVLEIAQAKLLSAFPNENEIIHSALSKVLADLAQKNKLKMIE